jgi:Flp pilus assembly protein TadD
MTGDMDGAIESWRKSLTIEPASAEVETDLGGALFQSGHKQEGIDALRKAVEIDPKFGNAHNELGTALAQTGWMDEAVIQLQMAVKLEPDSVEYRVNLGFAFGMEGDLPEAMNSLQGAVKNSDGKDWRSLAALAAVYDKAGRLSDAVRTVEQALDLAVEQNDDQTASELRGALEHYEQELAHTRSQ